MFPIPSYDVHARSKLTRSQIVPSTRGPTLLTGKPAHTHTARDTKTSRDGTRHVHMHADEYTPSVLVT
jgi:hypothetical protein